MKRIIHNIEFDRGTAEDRCDHLRTMRRQPRIYERTVRAENITCVVYVVVANEAQTTLTNESAVVKDNAVVKDTPPTEPLPVEAVAIILNCSPATVWRMVRMHKLEGRRYLARTVFDAADVYRLAQERGSANK